MEVHGGKTISKYGDKNREIWLWKMAVGIYKLMMVITMMLILSSFPDNQPGDIRKSSISKSLKHLQLCQPAKLLYIFMYNLCNDLDGIIDHSQKFHLRHQVSLVLFS